MLDPYAQRLNDTIIDIYDAIMRVESQMLARSVKDLTIVELHVLEAIGRAGEEGLSISDVAQARQVSLPSMTVTVKKLEQKGYVEKTRSARDGRIVQVHLTRRGRKYNAMHAYFHERMGRALLRDVPTAQRPALLDAVESIDAFLKGQLAQLDEPQ